VYESAGLGNQRYRIVKQNEQSEQTQQSALMVWDRAEPFSMMNESAYKPIVWVANAAAFPQTARSKLSGVSNEKTYANSAMGQLWLLDDVLHDQIAARDWYENWQSLRQQPSPYTLTAQLTAFNLRASSDTANNQPLTYGGQLNAFFALLLVLLFLAERILTHVRHRQ
jgi:hypothetical protein